MEKEVFPPGLNNAFYFAVFNALSFQIVLNSPMVLYAKSLGASATILGIIAGMMPLLVVFQIPAAQHVSRVGFKKFVYAGWGTRVMFIFGMASVPVTGFFLNESSRLGLLLTLLFGFNLSRGISSAGWLPWITSLVPPGIRGKYLSREAAWVNLSSFISFLLSALCLNREPHAWQFSLLFLFSGLMGASSLIFLKRIPDVESDELTSNSKMPVPWGELLRFPAFRKLLVMLVAWSMAYGGLATFTVVFLKTEIGFSEGSILLLNSVFYLGGLCSLWLLGSRLDAFGSKPVLKVSFGAWIMILFGWSLLAGKCFPPVIGLILLLQFTMGLGAALVTMSNTRLAMAIVPKMGRNHFFAIYSVVGNVTLGLAPMVWGLLLDAVGARQVIGAGMEWNRFSVFFLSVTLLLGLTLVLSQRLHEPEAASLESLLRDVLIHSPQRVWIRLWARE